MINLHISDVSGESASEDVDAVEKFSDDLEKVIEEGGYRPEQIFSVDKTGLYWKKEAKSMPNFKAFKNIVILPLGGNVAYKLKPSLIYHSKSRRALRQGNNYVLPVQYQANS